MLFAQHRIGQHDHFPRRGLIYAHRSTDNDCNHDSARPEQVYGCWYVSQTSNWSLFIVDVFSWIGRKEITFFFYLYMLLTSFSLILDSGVIPPGSGAYPWFAAAQNGLTSALCVCLLINGFVGFQLYEDGTTLSVWLLRGVSFAMFIITGMVSLATFKSWAGLGPTHTIGLFIVLYLVSGIELLVYVVMQTILVVNTLQDRWPLGDIAFGACFLIIGQVILYVFSNTICNAVQHYLDGLFFATICNLLAVMMVYKVRTPDLPLP